MPSLAALRLAIYHLIEEPTDDSSRAVLWFNYGMITLIVLNVMAVVLETIASIYHTFFWAFLVIDLISFTVFSVEYLLRLWVCTCNPAFQNPVTGRLRYAATPLAIVDLLAIAPFYLPFLIPIDLRVLRVLRLFRIIRILKLGRYSRAIRMFGHVIEEKKEQLIISLAILLFAIVIASSLMYYAENEAQPELFASIPHAMWWALVTLATVGYGDMYPVTAVGKVIGGVVLIVGIAIFALPTAIMASGFFEATRQASCGHKEGGDEMVCPACGFHFHPHDPDTPDPDAQNPPGGTNSTGKER